MSLPPDEVPTGLSPRQYRRLGIKYLLMGKSDLASEAFSLGYENSSSCESGNGEGEEESKRSYREGMRFGLNLTNAVMKLLQQQAGSSKQSQEGDSEECLSEIKQQLG